MATRNGLIDDPRWLALRTVDTSTARREISDLISDAERGERLIVSRNGKPRVAIIPLTDLALLLHRDGEVERRMVAELEQHQGAVAGEAIAFEDLAGAPPPTAGAAARPMEAVLAGVTFAPTDKVMRVATAVIADLVGRASDAAVAVAVKRLDQEGPLAAEDEREIREEVLECISPGAVESRAETLAEAGTG